MPEGDRAEASSAAAAVPASSILGRLRAETRVLHERIEGVVPILQPGADAASYRWYLQKLLGFHRPLEPALFATPGLEHWASGGRSARSCPIWSETCGRSARARRRSQHCPIARRCRRWGACLRRSVAPTCWRVPRWGRSSSTGSYRRVCPR